MQWNLRMRAAERGIWKSLEMRRLLAEAGLEISTGKMSMLWTTTPTTLRLEDLEVICFVLNCTPTDLLTIDPAAVSARQTRIVKTSNGPDDVDNSHKVTPRLGRNRSLPPA
ncbi:MAG: helix-turn-helix transcriptional regulator [Micropruina sp.]|nr:helix-turn-helix transcriptional regulator [Micropruina sp.]